MRTRRGFVIGAAIMLGIALTAPLGVATAKPAPSGAGHLTGITTLDIAGASSTAVTGKNMNKQVAGYYSDTTGVQHGFILTPVKKGSILTVVDVPAGLAATGTIVTSINDSGTVTGSYWTVDGIEYGFIRTAAGGFTYLEDPNPPGVPGNPWGIHLSQINNFGVVVGYYYTTLPDGQQCGDFFCGYSANHGFVWTASSGFTTYDYPAPPATGTTVSTRLSGINSSGVIVGDYTYFDSVDTIGHTPGFVLSGAAFTPVDLITGVTLTEIIDPWTPNGWCGENRPAAINDNGVVVGNSVNGCAPANAVWLWKSGTLTQVNLSDNGNGDKVLLADSINNNGDVGGNWYTWTATPSGPVNGPEHGFTASAR